MTITPKAIPTPSPAFAPVDSPDCACEDDVGLTVVVPVGAVVTAGVVAGRSELCQFIWIRGAKRE